ncbi:MAG: hypothetical protein B0D91_13460 [Oceanospirillales bacterium LUC14_002_19_P2]|nr:MAG: hypothetical protein B0D91_13460 [Oceanospirillales bacterium LUC14_002_19_P2]
MNLEDFKVGPRNLPGEWKKVTDVYAQTDYTGNPPGDHQLARFHHGAQHHARTAMWSLVLLQMLRDQGVPEALSFDNKDINLIILACLFHDSGRQGDGEDNPVWERNSGLNCRRFMEQHRYEDADINICQRAIEYKSKQSRFPCNGDSRARLVLWVLHFADALDVIRVREAFDPRIPMRQCRGFPPNQAVDVLQAYSSLADVVHQVVIDQGDWINGGKFSWAIKESLEKADNPLVGQLLYLQVTQPDTFHQIESLVNALLIA